MDAPASHRSLNRRDIDLAHIHHRRIGPLGGSGSEATGDRLHQHTRRDLPGDAPAILAPAAGAFLTAIAHNRIPIAVGFGLIVCGNLEGKRFVVREVRPAIEAHTYHARDGEFDQQHIALLAIGIVTRRAVYHAHMAVGKGSGVELGGFQRVAHIPETDGVLGAHGASC